MPKPRLVKQHGIKLTRGQRRQRREEMGLLGVSGKGAMWKLAGLRRTDSGFLTREPKRSFALAPEKSKRKPSDKTKSTEDYRTMKHGKKIKKGERPSGTRGAKPGHEAKKQKQKK